MKTIKFNGYLLPNVGAITTAVSDDVKKEYIRLIQKAFGGEYKFGAGANIYGVSDSTDWCNWVALDLEEANKLFTLLPISLATTWLKVALREITRENWVVDYKAEKEHPRINEFKEWINVRAKKDHSIDYVFNLQYYGYIDGELVFHNCNYAKLDSTPKITLDIFFTYFYEQEEKPKYVTGQRFKAKIQGTNVEGKIYVDESSELIYLLQNEVKGNNQKFISDLMGYKDGWCINHGDENELKYDSIQVTELELLPDPAEPVKGDEIEVSDNGVKWSTNVNKNYTRIYTGYQKKNGYYVYDYDGEIFSCKHIRLAPSPEKLAREQAEKKAREFMSGRDQMPRLKLLTEYIIEIEKLRQ